MSTVGSDKSAAVGKTVFWLLAVIALVLGITVYKYYNKAPMTTEQLESMGAVVFETPRIFTFEGLTNHDGQTFTKTDLIDGWTLMYFGYTFCPDICPAALSQLNKTDQWLKKNSPELANKMRYIMVTIDPRRDTVEKLKGYVPHFNPKFIGVTGDNTNIYALTRQLNIAFIPIVDPKDEFYLVDHSANLVIVNPRGDYHGIFRPPLEPEKLGLMMQSIISGYQ